VDLPGCGARAPCGRKPGLIRKLSLAAAVLCIGCGLARADDLADLRAVRSLAAEAAQVIRLESRHRVTGTYAREMKDSAREELRSEAEGATSPQVKVLAQHAISAVNANDTAALERIVRQLFAMEGPHGRAD
jgi:hypothetical protein